MNARPIAPGLWEYDTHGQPALLGSECESCGEIIFPQRESGFCPRCQSTPLRNVALSREGTVQASTVISQSPAGGYYHGPVPYGYGVVLLDDGLRVLTHVEVSEPPLPPGTRVRLVVDALYRDEAGLDVQAFLFVRMTP